MRTGDRHSAISTSNIRFEHADIDISFDVQLLNKFVDTSKFRSIAERGQRIDGIDQ